ncbi:hypothetical protein CEXT_27381 [Caerostris extrusa]|uniref:Uncharacterized protein n=1 Tax=Caerostris extrusa TaxID=172846 RepID=A0AAV4X345_CAEEX|nr:hypothetical protein CEXT_27381 [Caerostris extrusa]
MRGVIFESTFGAVGLRMRLLDSCRGRHGLASGSDYGGVCLQRVISSLLLESFTKDYGEFVKLLWRREFLKINVCSHDDILDDDVKNSTETHRVRYFRNHLKESYQQKRTPVNYTVCAQSCLRSRFNGLSGRRAPETGDDSMHGLAFKW